MLLNSGPAAKKAKKITLLIYDRVAWFSRRVSVYLDTVDVVAFVHRSYSVIIGDHSIAYPGRSEFRHTASDVKLNITWQLS